MTSIIYQLCVDSEGLRCGVLYSLKLDIEFTNYLSAKSSGDPMDLNDRTDKLYAC